jgi:hypothetical protein
VRRVAPAALLLLVFGVARAEAQIYVGNDTPHFGSLEVGGGFLWSKGYGLGTRCAEETRNPGTSTGQFCLFQTATDVAAPTGGVVRLGFYVSSAVAIEGSGQYLRPLVSSRLTGDAEEAPTTTASEKLTRIVVDGSVVFHLRRLTFGGGRAVPFVAGGAGYLRELHEGNELIETGKTYHAGGGVKFWLGQGPHRFGVRADIGASIRDGGFDFGKNHRTLPTAGLSVAYLF